MRDSIIGILLLLDGVQIRGLGLRLELGLGFWFVTSGYGYHAVGKQGLLEME